MELQIPTVTIDDLRAFHAQHFPHAPIPQEVLHGYEQDVPQEYYEDEDDGLGFYADGTKRTLTDEQIAMFRHSEIRAILRKRRLRREEGDLSEEGEAESDATQVAESPAPAAAPTPAPAAAPTPASPPQSGNGTQLPKQKWATSSARTKARNKRNRNKYRIKKREAREQKERAQKEGRALSDEDEESDEWDPWHQANGPDVQKDDTVDLDY